MAQKLFPTGQGIFRRAQQKETIVGLDQSSCGSLFQPKWENEYWQQSTGEERKFNAKVTRFWIAMKQHRIIGGAKIAGIDIGGRFLVRWTSFSSPAISVDPTAGFHFPHQQCDCVLMQRMSENQTIFDSLFSSFCSRACSRTCPTNLICLVMTVRINSLFISVRRNTSVFCTGDYSRQCGDYSRQCGQSPNSATVAENGVAEFGNSCQNRRL